jgi:hypothetical protein
MKYILIYHTFCIVDIDNFLNKVGQSSWAELSTVYTYAEASGSKNYFSPAYELNRTYASG